MDDDTGSMARRPLTVTPPPPAPLRVRASPTPTTDPGGDVAVGQGEGVVGQAPGDAG